MRYLIALSLAATCLLSGCARNTFISYPHEFQPIREALHKDNYQQAVKVATEQNKPDGNAELSLAELGHVQQLAGNCKASEKTFAKLIEKVRQRQLAAKIRMSRVLDSTGSLITNDNAIPYELKGYEIVLLYLNQGYNYLCLGQSTDARVSIRRALSEQKWIKQQNAKELAAADKKMKEKKLNFNPQSHSTQFQSTLSAAANVKSGYENGLADYLSAIMYQIDTDPSNAIISLKSALGLAPYNRYIQNDLLRLLKSGYRNNEYKQLMAQYKITKAPKAIPKTDARVYVIWQQGQIPEMTSINVPLPLPGFNQLQSIAFPVYAKIRPVPTTGTVQLKSIKGTLTVDAEPELLTNIQNLAAKSLVDDYPLIFTRAALRLVTKTAATDQAGKKNPWAGLAMQIFSLVTSEADLRSWLSLPYTINVANLAVPAGQYQLQLTSTKGQWHKTIKLSPRQSLIIWADSSGQKILAKALTLAAQS